MSSDDSVSQWIRDVREGREGISHERLVERFLDRLTALARKKLGSLRTFEDEEDVANSVLKSFFMRAPKGEFDQLTDRDSLWSLLAAITLNKTASLQRRHLAKKRDVRRSQSLEVLLRSDPPPEMVDALLGEARHLLEVLPEGSLREIARLRIEGYSNQEIADRFERSVKTIERKLALIRKYLATELAIQAKR